MALIESKDLALKDALNDFYVVPDYQREYVWQAEHVTEFLDDIFDAFDSDDPREPAEYFIGSIVACRRADNSFELVDGQQRLTTTYLFLCAVRAMLRKHGETLQVLESQIRSSQITSSGTEVFRYRLELQYRDSRDYLETIATEQLPNQQSLETLSGKNLANAYDIICEFIRTKLAESADLKRFYAFFTSKVKLIRIEALSLSQALRIFETINDRGRSLDAMDLLKNLLFMNARDEDFEDLKVTWKEIVDLIYTANEKPLRFLRYLIIADYDADRIREDEIYPWFVDNKERVDYERHPIQFARRLREAANAYVNILSGKTPTGSDDPSLRNIRRFAGSARQYVILLLAARSASTSVVKEISRAIEDLLFAYTIVREPAREYERLFAFWATFFRSVQTKDELGAFWEENVRPELDRLAPRFRVAFETCSEDSVTKGTLRYILAKLTQWTDMQAIGDGANSLDAYFARGLEVEHILPQSPGAEAIAVFGPDYERYIRLLGNLALVEQPINASLGNRPFAEKKPVYPRSRFYLTKLIGGREGVGSNTSIDRALQLMTPIDFLDPASLVKRQQELTDLAHLTWSIPTRLTLGQGDAII